MYKQTARIIRTQFAKTGNNTNQSVSLKQKVDNVTDNPDAELQFKAIHEKIIDMCQHHRQHSMTTIYKRRQHRLPHYRNV